MNFLKLTALVGLLVSTLNLSAQECQDNWLSANGSKIVDINGTEVYLRGINWYGFETQLGFPHGMSWTRSMKGVLQQMKDLGFNCLRIPWSNETIFGDKTLNIGSWMTDPYTGNGPNDLQEESEASTPIELLDLMVEWCQENDMRIILDNHTRHDDNHLEEDLWYIDSFSHEQWINDWVSLAERYIDYPAVVAMDLNNEPHERATWGSGDPATDWKMAAEECGNAILAVNPNVLILVEGIQRYTKPDGEETNFWWGGNLQGARDFPVELNVPNKLVYSPHEYGPHLFVSNNLEGGVTQPWFEADSFVEALPTLWEEYYNFINSSDTAPVLLGEFGIKSQLVKSEQWFSRIVDYIDEQGLHFTYWCVNPDSGDTGGILAGDWVTVEQWKMDYLQPLLHVPIPNCIVYTGVPEEPSLSNEEFIAEVADFKVFPNPTTEMITFSTSSSNLKEVVLYNILGAQVYAESSIESNSVFEFNISNLANGIYLAEVTSVKGVKTTVKVIKN